MQHLSNEPGFDARSTAADPARGRALPGLLASAALAAGTLVAATVVSMGIARAGGLETVVENESGVFLVALLLGALFVASCLTKALAPRRNERREAMRSGFNRDFLSR